MDELFKYAMSTISALLGLLYWKNERELQRLSKNAHDDREKFTPISVFNLHVKAADERHEEAKEGRRELLNQLGKIDAKLDRLIEGKR